MPSRSRRPPQRVRPNGRNGEPPKKKSLGQHFLRAEDDAARIAAALEPLPEGGRVLEVGPGAGALTVHLLARGDLSLWACEFDDHWAAALPERFPALAGRVLHRDFLRLRPEELPPAPFAVAGNFPYNISSQIVFRILDWRDAVPVAVGMFQREVARRLAAGPGSKEYGVLSVLCAVWYEVEYLFELPPEAFDPPPKVHSAVVRLRRRRREPVPDPEGLRRLVKAAFAMRRKKLRNALKGWASAERLADPLFDRRAEELDPAAYEALAAELSPPA